MTPLVAPSNPTVKVTIRLGMPLMGHYMEAVLDSEIKRVAAAQAARTDAIHGTINMVAYSSEPNPDTTYWTYKKGDMTIGRFGVKAREPTIDDFVADALQNDIGITSPLRPTEFANPDGLIDDLKPGVDVTAEHVNRSPCTCASKRSRRATSPTQDKRCSPRSVARCAINRR